MSELKQEKSHHIVQLDGALKAVVELEAKPEAKHWLLSLRLIYDGEAIGQTSFNLHGYSETEAKNLIHRLRHHEFIMREIDDLLFGDSDT